MKLSPRKLVRRKGRTAMTIIAVATSMALLISMQSIAEGMVQNATSTIEKSKVDIAMGASEGHGIKNGHEVLSEVEDDDEVRHASIQINEYMSFRIPETDKRRWAITNGLIPEASKPLLHPDERKRFPKDGYFGFQEGGDPHYADGFTGPWTYEVLIDENMAGDYGLSEGDRIEISKSIDGPYVSFNISGIFDSQLSGTGIAEDLYFMVMHLSELQSLAGLDKETKGNQTEVVDRIDGVYIGLSLEMRTEEGKVKEYQEELEDRYPFYNVVTKGDRLRQIEQQMTIVHGFFLAIGGVSLIIGLLFVTCVMFMSVIERTNEIGMLRAIGISRRTVFLQILQESVFIVFIGALLGIVPGYFGSILGAEYIKDTVGTTETLVVFSPPAVAQLFVSVIILGSLISMAPAWRAMRLDIIRSLKRVK